MLLRAGSYASLRVLPPSLLAFLLTPPISPYLLRVNPVFTSKLQHFHPFYSHARKYSDTAATAPSLQPELEGHLAETLALNKNEELQKKREEEPVDTPREPPTVSFQDLTLPGNKEYKPFEFIGIRPVLADALSAAFPNVKEPTLFQTSFIPAVLARKDVFARVGTGEGKSFSLLLSLLSLSRTYSQAWNSFPNPNTLLLVPTSFLALQFLHWSRQLLPPTVLPRTIAILTRPTPESPTSVLDQVRAIQASGKGVHVLVATVGALSDLPHAVKYGSTASSTKEAVPCLWLNATQTVALDEVDSILSLPALAPLKKQQQHRLKMKKKLDRTHLAESITFLRELYAERDLLRQLNPSVSEWADKIQFLGLGATVGEVEREFVCEKERWCWSPSTSEGQGLVLLDSQKKEVMSASGMVEELKKYRLRAQQQQQPAERAILTPSAKTHHHIIVVSPNLSLRNVLAPAPSTQALLPPISIPTLHQPLLAALPAAKMSPLDLTPNQRTALEAKLKPIPSPHPVPEEIEAAALLFALSLQHSHTKKGGDAVLFVPHGSNIRQAVGEMRELGVNAVQLDLTGQREGGEEDGGLVRRVMTGGLGIPQKSPFHTPGAAGSTAPSIPSLPPLTSNLRGDEKSEETPLNTRRITSIDPTIPLMYVTTPIASRGLDLPGLSTIYILSRSLRTTSDYIQFSGRVGRLGSSSLENKVVTIALGDAQWTPKERRDAMEEREKWELVCRIQQEDVRDGKVVETIEEQARRERKLKRRRFMAENEGGGEEVRRVRGLMRKAGVKIKDLEWL